MKKTTRVRCAAIALAVGITTVAFAENDIAAERQQLMEDVRDASKPIGAMFKGEAEYNAETVQASLATMADAASRLGDLVPVGSEGGEAAAAIWEDPAGFAAAIEKWRLATDAAIAANPASLEEAKPTVGPVFGACKNCHDNFRVEKE